MPVDGRLHDIWGLLAYFGGTGKGGDGAHHHQAEAEKIAEEGRRWAERGYGDLYVSVVAGVGEDGG